MGAPCSKLPDTWPPRPHLHCGPAKPERPVLTHRIAINGYGRIGRCFLRALQESGLHNLSYGDRDSLGLFQQRPSQGWGTPAQIMSPRHAAAAFYRRLSRIAGWQAMPVTEAAQTVQHSAAR